MATRKKVAKKKLAKKVSAQNTKPHTTAILESVEITWTGQKGRKKMKVNLNEASGIFWGPGGTIPAGWYGDNRIFPEARPAASGAPQMRAMSMPTDPENPALCWWDESLQQWICPLEPDTP